MKIFDIELVNVKYKDFFQKLVKFDKQNIIFTPNPEILLATKKDLEFRDFLKKADLLLPDWIGLYIAFQILDNKYWRIINTLLLPYFFFNLFFKRKNLYKKYWEKICWSDLTKDLVEYAEKNNIKICIIDLYNPTDAKKVESQKIFPELLKNKFSKLDFDYFIYSPQDKENIIKQISASDSKMLFSTLWMKKQEESVIEIMWKAENIKVWLGIWSSFDYFIWFQKRAPRFWRTLWLEWLYRLITWPQKINRLKRIYNAIFVFIKEVLKEK